MYEDTRAGNNNETRRYTRVKALHLVSYVNMDSGTQLTPVSIGRTLDVSEGGIRLEVFEEVAPGAIIEVQVAVGETLLTCRGKTIHTKDAGGGAHIIGVKFDEPQPMLGS